MMNEQQALQLLSELNGKSFDDMLAAAKSAGFDEMQVKLRFQDLHQKRYVSGAFVLGLPVFITLEGSDRLDQLNQEAEDKAKQERQQRFDNKISVATLLVSLISFIAGVFVEHFAGIVALVLSFFHP